jgi:hypothetical protein
MGVAHSITIFTDPFARDDNNPLSFRARPQAESLNLCGWADRVIGIRDQYWDRNNYTQR